MNAGGAASAIMSRDGTTAVAMQLILLRHVSSRPFS